MRTILGRMPRGDAGDTLQRVHDFGQGFAQLPGQEIFDVARAAVLRQRLHPKAQDPLFVGRPGAGSTQAVAKEADGCHGPSLPRRDTGPAQRNASHRIASHRFILYSGVYIKTVLRRWALASGFHGFYGDAPSQVHEKNVLCGARPPACSCGAKAILHGVCENLSSRFGHALLNRGGGGA